ncbi:ABC transporter ATP-binding protein [Nocardioides daphniae]|uniref:ABC transporter ATP-binding protein n=1 Tax=Nocardioides daphniae TaxID=402297 RepID=A0A4P7UDH2_9ACTN|nr:ABC transporter ATP-binding protein [Nocardioides daphniae]QCC77378.1 ABC transporter ATP-binding protein [Nocardioides daphniae]GGD24729.1 ABC transporter ATP-binding protein [Nocardioides daphniae]
MIDLDNITLTYPDGTSRITAVDDVSLRVAAGTVVGLTGPSGSGKSSLLAVASTLIRPDRGTVTIDGIDATNLDLSERAELRRTKVGLVFQQSNLLGSLTAYEQLLVMNELTAQHARRAARAATRERARHLLDTVGLAADAEKRPAQLSGGERQRVNIARALMHEPAVLIVDEPTSALDQERGGQIVDLLLRLTAQHSTATLLVTHDRRILPRLTKTHVMVDGHLTAEGSMADQMRG